MCRGSSGNGVVVLDFRSDELVVLTSSNGGTSPRFDETASLTLKQKATMAVTARATASAMIAVLLVLVDFVVESTTAIVAFGTGISTHAPQASR